MLIKTKEKVKVSKISTGVHSGKTPSQLIPLHVRNSTQQFVHGDMSKLLLRLGDAKIEALAAQQSYQTIGVADFLKQFIKLVRPDEIDWLLA